MDHRPLILDGGLATELEANGFQLQVLTIIPVISTNALLITLVDS